MRKVASQIRVTFATPDSVARNVDAREDFWNRAVRQAPREFGQPDFSSAEFENRLIQELGRHLHNLLQSDFFPVHERAWRGEGALPIYTALTATDPRYRELRLASAVRFAVADVHYGSLDFSLEIAGIEQLVKLFDGNLDGFLMFLVGYLPHAFQSTFDLQNVSHLRIEVSATPSLAAAFGDSQQVQHAPLSRDRLLWLLANGTLVVPVLLSLLVLYVGYKGLADYREQYHVLLRELSSRERALYGQAGSRVKDLEQLHMQTLQLLDGCCCKQKHTPATVEPICAPQQAQQGAAGDAPQAARP